MSENESVTVRPLSENQVDILRQFFNIESVYRGKIVYKVGMIDDGRLIIEHLSLETGGFETKIFSREKE